MAIVIQEHRNIGDGALFLEPCNVKHHRLGAPDGERRHHDDATTSERLREPAADLGFGIDRRVQSVSVSRFGHRKSVSSRAAGGFTDSDRSRVPVSPVNVTETLRTRFVRRRLRADALRVATPAGTHRQPNEAARTRSVETGEGMPRRHSTRKEARRACALENEWWLAYPRLLFLQMRAVRQQDLARAPRCPACSGRGREIHDG